MNDIKRMRGQDMDHSTSDAQTVGMSPPPIGPADISDRTGAEAATTAFAVALAGIEPLVEELEHYFDLPVDSTDARDRNEWLKACGGPRSARSLATDAVLLELCERIAGARPECAFLKAARSRVKVAGAAIEAATDLCRSDAAMLGPLYESAAARQERYALGQYFTPALISEFMARVVSSFGAESVFDPAIGAGALLSTLPTATRVHGLDISPICIALALAGLLSRGFRDIAVGRCDFLAEHSLFSNRERPKFKYDAVICNPPYMRHHLLAKDEKRRLTSRYGALFKVELSTLSTNYVYFFLEALERLREGGLLVFITPADFLDTKFGQGLRRVLATQTTIDEMLLFDRDELAFAGVLTTSAITVARKCAPPARHHVSFAEATVSDGGIGRRKPNRRLQVPLEPAERWSTFFGQREADLSELTKDRPRALSDYLRVRRGIATGANDFFVISQSVVDEWRIEREYLLPVVASARDLPDGDLSSAAWEAIRERGRPCWFLAINDSFDAFRSKNVWLYLEYGVQQGVPERFNCRTRSPWYKPENVAPPDIIITYMNRGRTRFVLNSARCRVMSAFLNGFVLNRDIDLAELLAALNAPETSALIERLGRTYGGGLGKIEPRELSALPMPELSATPLLDHERTTAVERRKPEGEKRSTAKDQQLRLLER